MSSWSRPTRRHQHRSSTSVAPAVADHLLKLADAGLAGAIFVAPLLLGGRHDFGRFVLSIFVAVAAVAWFTRQVLLGNATWRRRPAHALLLAAGTLLIAQLLHLPAAWLDRLAPRVAVLLPTWSGDVGAGELGRWSTLSLAPETTRLSLAMLATYALLFITASCRIESRRDVERLLTWISFSAALVAFLGLLQAAFPNGRFLWVYEHPTETTLDRLSGPFANRNHFAHFVVLGMSPLAAWLLNSLTASKGERRAGGSRPSPASEASLHRAALPASAMRFNRSSGLLPGLALVALALCAITVLLTASRGGTIALVVAAATFCVLLYQAGQLRGREIRWLIVGGAMLFLAATFIGHDGIFRRLGALTTASLDDVDEQGARRRLWAANISAIKEGGWFGAGAGSHRYIYPVYLADPPIKEHTHAENGYLQVVTECGLAGGLLLAAALALSTAWCARAVNRCQSRESALYAAACVAGLTASAAHSLFDFVWYIPACLTATIILAVCAMRLGELEAPDVATARVLPSLRPASIFNVAVPLVLLVAFALSELAGPAIASVHWDAYHRMASAQLDVGSKLLAMDPAAAEAIRIQRQAANEAALLGMIRQLEAAVAYRPRFAAAHRQLASRYLELYHLRAERSDNFMPAPQLREAAVASGFRSAAELRAWLDRALGENARLLLPALKHARAAAALAPLQGSPYVRLSVLCFLQGQRHAATDAYLQQALLVRPYDGDLLFEVGADLCSRNYVDAGLSCWQRSLQIRGAHRLKVARAIAGRMHFSNLVERFRPEWDTLPELWKVYRHADEGNVAAFLNYATAETLREVAAADAERTAVLWRRLADVQLQAGHREASIVSLQHSFESSADDYATRRMLGMVLSEAGQLADATAHLQWCRDRQADDAPVAEALTRITRERVAARTHEAPSLR